MVWVGAVVEVLHIDNQLERHGSWNRRVVVRRISEWGDGGDGNTIQ